jgi:1,4-alpha-glucan branching enzyme
MWEVEHRAERDMIKYTKSLPWRTDTNVAEALKWAGRELMLLQASDWPFIVENGSALDYAVKRFSLHSERFQRALDIARGKSPASLNESRLAEMRAHDRVLEDLDLSWWE